MNNDLGRLMFMTEEQRKRDCEKCVHCDKEYLKNNTEGCARFYFNRYYGCCDSFKISNQQIDI